MDSMFVPEGYTRVYWWSFLYIFSLTLPHSTAVQLAWPDQALHNGEQTLSFFKRLCTLLGSEHLQPHTATLNSSAAGVARPGSAQR
jgi:hypothetical protein